MVDAMNLAQSGTLPPELYQQQQELNRQQKMAQLLMQQGQQQPQGQMISGRYVAPSIFQNLAGLAQTAAGAYLQSQGDEKALDLAKGLRDYKTMENEAISRAAKAKDWQSVLDLSAQSYTGAGKEYVKAAIENLVPKASEPKVVGNYLVGSDGKVMFKAPKEYAPHAPQLVQTQNGFVRYDPNSGSVSPVQAPAGLGGAGGALMPPLPTSLQGEVSSINQQMSSINDAIKTVEKNPNAFGSKFAVPGLLGGEFGTAKMNAKLPSEQVEARAKVFNIASSVIKERAGTAQSKQEQEVIMRFLPSPYDGDKAIKDKFVAFNDYLESKEKGINPVQGAVKPYRPSATPTESKPTISGTQNFDPALLQYMTPEQQALFGKTGK